jgi:hypothetical protein
MPRRHVPGTTSIALDVAVEAKQRFLALHGTLALKTKAETFEALVYSVSTKDILSPHAIERIERKLDYIIETLDGLA